MTDQDEFILTALVRRGRELAAEIASLTAEKQKIVSRIEELTPVGWRLDVDGVPATRRPGNRTFSQELAIRQFTPEEKMECVKTGVDPTKVREIAEAKGIVEACMVLPDESKTRVKLA